MGRRIISSHSPTPSTESSDKGHRFTSDKGHHTQLGPTTYLPTSST